MQYFNTAMLLNPIQSIQAPGPMSTGAYDSCLPVGGRIARRGEHDAPALVL